MSLVHVAVAVIVKPAAHHFNNQILISKRPDHVHQGGLWEFPGGKVEKDECVIDALARELDEELGIQIDSRAKSLVPLIEIHHDYGDKQVFLDVWLVSEFTGEPHGREGQPVRWVSTRSLVDYSFPAANKPIISASRLPRDYAITPEYDSLDLAKQGIEHLLHQGCEMLLFRQPQLTELDYLNWARSLLPMCKTKCAKLLASGSIRLLDRVEFDGLQLPFREAKSLDSRSIGNEFVLGVSCHNEIELKHAEMMGADFATLSPVKLTASHPETAPLGWHMFAEKVRCISLPVYALGGLGQDDYDCAIRAGAQGIAGIRCWQT